MRDWGSAGGAKGGPRGKRKKSQGKKKMALAVQSQVNSSISPAADGSNGQETTAENKAPRCSAGPARLARTRPLPDAGRRGRKEKGFLFPASLPWGGQDTKSKSLVEGAKSLCREMGGSSKAEVELTSGFWKLRPRPARKNARNAVAGGRGAAQQGAPDHPPQHPPPGLLNRRPAHRASWQVQRAVGPFSPASGRLNDPLVGV